MSIQDLYAYHSLVKLNKILFLNDVISNDYLFKTVNLDNNMVEVIPLFYCDRISVSEPSDDVLIFDTYKIILPSSYNGLIHFESEVDDDGCDYSIFLQTNHTLILVYNKFFENVPNKRITVNYYLNNQITYTYMGETDKYGYNQHQLPQNINYNRVEVIL